MLLLNTKCSRSNKRLLNPSRFQQNMADTIKNIMFEEEYIKTSTQTEYILCKPLLIKIIIIVFNFKNYKVIFTAPKTFILTINCKY